MSRNVRILTLITVLVSPAVSQTFDFFQRPETEYLHNQGNSLVSVQVDWSRDAIEHPSLPMPVVSLRSPNPYFTHFAISSAIESTRVYETSDIQHEAINQNPLSQKEALFPPYDSRGLTETALGRFIGYEFDMPSSFDPSVPFEHSALQTMSSPIVHCNENGIVIDKYSQSLRSAPQVHPERETENESVHTNPEPATLLLLGLGLLGASAIRRMRS
ncbi:MAG: PEP-CTERM sorting domain-containing protein [candidate division Zixibacteria bacterium]|nr:PEP-CTERM sorting domain-containing protein [candidate division Zixibacteria bacterium]